MSRVSHLRALFEEKVRQSNEEKERSKGQLSSPKGGNRRRDSFNSSSGSLFDRSNSNVNNSLTPSHSQENFPIEHATSTTDTNEKKQDMYFHVVQEPRSYPHIHREDSKKSLTNIEHVVTPDDTQAKVLPKEEISTPVNDNLHIDVAHVQAHQVAEQQQARDHHVNRQSPRDLPTVPEVHVVPEEPSQPSPRLEEPQNDASNVSSEATNEEQHQQHGEDGQPRSGIWKVEVLPSRSPRNLSTINEEGNASSTEPSPRANHSSSAQSTPRGDINDTAASPEVTPHVTEEPTSNIDAHQHVEIASDTHVKALGALSIVDDYIATPDAEHHVEDETPKQLLKVKHEDLEDMENLRQEEIDTVKLKLGVLELKHITLGVLLIAHQGQWEVTNLNGILILAVDYVRKSYVLRLYKRDTCSAVWEHRFHKGFIYQQATPTFHTFETSEHNPLIYGLKLFDEQDAKDLHSKVLYFKNTVVKTKEELEAEKQQKSVAPLPAAQPQPAQQAPNTNTDTNSKKKNKDKKNKRGFFDKIFGKSDSSSAPKDFQISGPSNFKHASHIGVDDKGEFQITNIPAEWKEIFRQAGIRKQDIKDMETFNFVVNVINDAVETQQAVAIQEERQQLHESNEAIVNNTNATTSPDVDQEPQASVVVEVKKPPPLPPRPAFMKEEHVDAQQPVETKPEVVVVERQVTPSEPTEVPSEHQQSPNMASPAPPPPPPPPVITPEAKSPTVKKSILADLPPPPPARATLMSEIQQGTKLRKVDTSDQSLPDIKGLNQKQTKSLADTLAQAMAARRYEMQEAPSPVMTSNDDDWD